MGLHTTRSLIVGVSTVHCIAFKRVVKSVHVSDIFASDFTRIDDLVEANW